MKDREFMRVYFIATKDLQFVKIGVAISPRTRLRELLAGHPTDDQLVLIASFPGTHFEEGLLHKHFHSERTRREWFRFTDRIKNYIDSCEKSAQLVFSPNKVEKISQPIPASVRLRTSLFSDEEKREILKAAGLTDN